MATVALFASCLLDIVGATQGVVEGDTRTQVFVNSVFMAPDRISLPVLPMNSVRRFAAYLSQAEVVPIRGQLIAGDILAIKVVSERPPMTNWTNPVGEVETYPGLAGFIAAFDDGTMTSDAWKCTDDPFDRDTLRWHSPLYNDSAWLNATVQPLSCCPWRDVERMWRTLAARWIGVQRSTAAGPREFFCRYKVPGGNRLPEEFTDRASLDAPGVRMVRFSASSSQVQVSFSVDRRAIVSCMAVDARYKLRAPIAAEMQAQGVTSGVLEAKATVWKSLGPYFNPIDYDVPALAFHSVTAMEDCETLCDANPLCNGITFYEAGVDLTSGGNCKLVRYHDLNRTLPPSNIHRFTHRYSEPTPIVHAITMTGIFLPGTIYDAYCSSEDPTTGNHSTWAVIEQYQSISNRTAGCLDCGANTPPVVSVRGGWASTTELTAVMSSNKAGRIFCLAVPYPAPTTAFTPENIKAAYNVNVLTQAGTSVPVQMSGLTPATEHETACLADSDGGVESTAASIQATRRRWFTESIVSPIMGISVQNVIQDGLLTINVFVQMGAKGLLWCRELTSAYTRNSGVPRDAWLRANGILSRVEDLVQETPGSFPGLDVNTSYEIYCVAEETSPTNTSVPGGGEMKSPYPVVTILDPVTANYDAIKVLAQVDRGPSSIFCLAKMWSYVTQKEPSPPDQGEMIASPYTVNVPAATGGIAAFEIDVPYIGSFYDVYCYSEEQMELPPPGSAAPPRKGMNSDAIRQTRRTVQTVGASFKNDGWLCTAGVPCSITDERLPPRLPLLATHRVLARANPCPGRCVCNGEEDANRKGAFCSIVSHDPLVAPPFRSRPDDVEKSDPRGHWCYVRPGLCYDQELSSTFPSLWISYAACAFNLTISREGAGPTGFPNEGLARVAGPTGRTFSWGSSNIMAGGASYYLCWCDSLTSPCALEVDFRLSLGRLHVAGPSTSQTQANSECVAGQPCFLRRFHGHALEDGSRLVALPSTAAGCGWQKEYPLDPPGIVGFPRDGVSLKAIEVGSTYSWGGGAVLAAGGRYILCWCGASVLHPGMGGGRSCPDARPDSGEGFLMPAGYLTVVGPVARTLPFYCSLGLVCEVRDVQGVGIRGGDRAIATSGSCGQPSPPPDGWATGIEELRAAGLADGWLDGGWLRYGPVLSGCMLRSIGAPVATTCHDNNSSGSLHEGPPNLTAAGASSRGILGFPNGGMSERSTLPGSYRWDAPAWAFAGDYSLCWCADSAPSCSRPEDYKALIGKLRLEGPSVLPLVSQVHICVRGKSCTIRGFRGRMPFNSQLFVASAECGSPVPPGVPNEGISLPSRDSTTYSWGSDRLTLAPGKYRLCWCSKVGFCTRPRDFGAYSGMLQVKGLLGNDLYVYCSLGHPCVVNGIQGEGLQNGDEVRVLTVCGHGKTPEGFESNGKAVAQNGGTSIVVPPAHMPGRYSLCWCPAGDPAGNVQVLCSRPEDYRLYMGTIEVGGPNPAQIHLCYEWQPCEIPQLQGTTLHSGDRLLVAPPGTDCPSQGSGPIRPLLGGWNGTWPPPGHPTGRRRRFPHATPVFYEFPQGGVSSPATGGGHDYSWGQALVRTRPGLYTLCWCNSASVPGGCTARGPFTVTAGSLRVGTFAEHAYLHRPPDPPPRDMDQWYSYALAVPLPFFFFVTIFAGWRKLSARMSRSEVEARVFGARPSLARIAQAKAKQFHEVKQVKSTRSKVDSQGLRAAGIGRIAVGDVPNFQALEDDATLSMSTSGTRSMGRAVTFASSGPLAPTTPDAGERTDELAMVPMRQTPTEGASRRTASRRTAPPSDPRGGMQMWEEPPEVPPPPAQVTADFSAFRRNPEVLEMLGRS